MTLLNKREHLFTLHDLTIGSNLEHEQKHFTKQLKHQVNCSSRQKLNTLQLHDANVHVHNTGKQIWDTNSTCPETFKNMFWVFFNTHLYIHHQMCYFSISTKYYENIIHIIMIGYIYDFHVAYKYVFFPTLLKI